MSRIGKKPIALPKGVTVKVADGAVEVKGPKGQLRQLVPPGRPTTRRSAPFMVWRAASWQTR